MALLKRCHYWLCFGFILLALKLTPYGIDVLVYLSVIIVVSRLSEWLLASSRKVMLNPKLASDGKAILITGCDTGMGHQLAMRMDKLGFKVFAACLQPNGSGAKSLVNSCSSQLQVLPLDVTKDDSVQQSVEFVKKNLGNYVLWSIVNNAGIVQAGEIDWTPVQDFERVVDVNLLGIVRVSKAFLPLLRESKGRIVNTTSILGKFTCAGLVGYCMSKGAATILTGGLRTELMKWGIKCISIEPFFYRTPLTSEEINMAIIQRAWDNSDEETRLAYGDEYLAEFKRRCKYMLGYNSKHVHEVLDCLEDAINSTDPLDSYFPCYLLYKIGIKLFTALPWCLVEGYQQYILPYWVQPAALVKSKKV